jgi:hypothetical protein
MKQIHKGQRALIATPHPKVRVINLERTPRRRDEENYERRAAPIALMPLADPDDPTPPLTGEIMNTATSGKFKMSLAKLPLVDTKG